MKIKGDYQRCGMGKGREEGEQESVIARVDMMKVHYMCVWKYNNETSYFVQFFNEKPKPRPSRCLSIFCFIMWSRVPTCAMMGCYREDHPQS
jgi:hypothetical protein